MLSSETAPEDMLWIQALPMNEIEFEQVSDYLRLLAVCFYEPDYELFLDEQLGPKLVQAVEQINPALGSPAGRMAKALTEIDEKQMTVDYSALFVGPFELLAPPYGSVYMESTRRIMGDSTMDVLRQYHDAGVKVEIEGPPDHIAIELEFLYYLCNQIANSLQVGSIVHSEKMLQSMKLFLKKSFLPWIPDFCKSIREGMQNRFYLALADCLEGTAHHLSNVFMNDTFQITPHHLENVDKVSP